MWLTRLFAGLRPLPCFFSSNPCSSKFDVADSRFRYRPGRRTASESAEGDPTNPLPDIGRPLPRPFSSALLALTILTVGLVPRSLADPVALWPQNGVPVFIPPSSVWEFVATPDEAGGAIVCWTASGGSFSDILAQRVDGAGGLPWAPDEVMVCSAAEDQWSPQIIPDGTGGAIIAWRDNRDGFGSDDIYAQRLDATGTPLWDPDGVPVCTAPGSQGPQGLAPDGSGGTIVCWYDGRSAGSGTYAQRINGDGDPVWESNGVRLIPGSLAAVCIASDGSGGAIIATVVSTSIRAQRVDADGEVQWTPGGVPVSGTVSAVGNLGCASTGSGGAVMAWTNSASGNIGAYAQLLNAAGERQWASNGVLLDNEETDEGAMLRGLVVDSDGAGGGILAWSTFEWFLGDPPGIHWDVSAQRVTAGGGLGWGAAGLSLCPGPHTEGLVSLAENGSGGAIFTWGDFRSAPDNPGDLYAQMVDADGNRLWSPTGFPICTAPGKQGGQNETPLMVPDGEGGAVVVWLDHRDSAPGVYAQRVSDCFVPAVAQWSGLDGPFENPASWFDGVVPGIGDRVLFGPLISGPTVSFSSSPTTQDVTIDYLPVTFDLNSQTYTLNEYDACAPGFTQSLTVNGDHSLGEGSLAIGGGTGSRVLANGSVVVGPKAPFEQPARATLTVTGGAQLVVDDDNDGDSLVLGDPDQSHGDPLHGALSWLLVQDGGQLRTRNKAQIGYTEGDTGTVWVNGVGSLWNGPDAMLGREGCGVLLVDEGATVDLYGVQVGGAAGSSGRIFVSDAGTRLQMAQLDMAAPGKSFLELQHAAHVDVYETVLVGLGDSIRVLDAESRFLMNYEGATALVEGGALVLGDESDPGRPGGRSSVANLRVGTINPASRLTAVFGARLAWESAIFGQGSSGQAIVMLSGQGTHVGGDNLLAGSEGGDAAITISDGARLGSQHTVVLAPTDGGSGHADVTVTITGANSILTVGELLQLGSGDGSGGTATLLGGNGGTVQSPMTRVHLGSEVHSNLILIGPGPVYVPPPPVPGKSLAATDSVVAVPGFYTDTLVVMAGATIVADSLILSEDGVIRGDGALDLPLVNDGALCPGSDSATGTFFVARDYVQTADGTLCITLAQTHDALHVAGSATLGGTLTFDFVAGSPPPFNQSKTIVTGHPVIGKFDNEPTLGKVTYTDTSVVWQRFGRESVPALSPLPPKLALGPVLPNPVRGSATIAFALPKAEGVTIDLFDVSGRLVRRLTDEAFGAGHHAATWDGRNEAGESVGAGVYFARLRTAKETSTLKVVVVK